MNIDQVKKGHKRLITKGGTHRELTEAHTAVSIEAVIAELEKDLHRTADDTRDRIQELKQLKDG